jgi:hypothetical protein
MNRFIKVTNAERMVRDIKTGAILNQNETEYENYIKRKEQLQRNKEQINKQSEEINNLKNELSEIKQMLLSLMHK